MRWVVAIVLVSSQAVAEPERGQLELAIHGGIDDRRGNDQTGSLDPPEGTGGAFDAELGWRYRAFSVAGFYAYSRMHASGHIYDTQGMPPFDYNEWFRFSDFGLRGRVHAHGAFAGITIAREKIVEPYEPDRSGLLLDVHIGYESPELPACHCAVEAIASKGTFTMSDWWDFSSYRLVAGVRFHWPVDW